MKATNALLIMIMASTLIACSKKHTETFHTQTVVTEVRTEVKKETETVTVTDEKNNSFETIYFNSVVDQKTMASGDAEIDSVRLTPLGTAKAASITMFSCSSDIDEAMTVGNGLMLLNNSSVLIKREIAKTQNVKANATYSCKNDIAEQVENIDKDLIDQKALSAGDSIVEYVAFAGERPAVTDSELSYITCADSKQAALKVLTHGVNLVKGSRLLVRRDNRSADQAEFALITCQ